MMKKKCILNKTIIGAFGLCISSLAHTADLGSVEVPSQNSVQGGIGILSGWKCSAGALTAQFDDKPPMKVAYGTLRTDTASACGTVDTGFSLLINYNDLGDGVHTVRVYDNNVLFKEATFTVVTPGESFLRGATGTCTVQDFPHSGQQATLNWQEAQQNFVMTNVTNNGGGSGGSGGGSGSSGGVSDTCSPANFTIAKYDAIAAGMTLDQVNQIIGCKGVYGNITVSNDFTLYRWFYMSGPVYMIEVHFLHGVVIDPPVNKVRTGF